MLEVKFVSYPSRKIDADYVAKEVYVGSKFVGVVITSTALPEDVEDCKKRYSFANEYHLKHIYVTNERGEKTYAIVLTDLNAEEFESLVPSEIWSLKIPRNDIGYGLLGKRGDVNVPAKVR
ncbi:hypothetical protein DRP04_00840 [Archaeoglobales archaeon]|nr:MAG: hypothetical protein DRP04_00840 [Archaeoglobales archaeon]